MCVLSIAMIHAERVMHDYNGSHGLSEDDVYKLLRMLEFS
jgi:hypothetical protein